MIKGPGIPGPFLCCIQVVLSQCLAELGLDVLYAFCKFILSDEGYDVSDAEAA